MYSYIQGTLAEKNPAYAVIEVNGIGYLINISLYTFGIINPLESCKLLLHHVIREDYEALYGFADTRERDLFRHLISVSGIGANTARLILSSLNPEELTEAIISKDVDILKSVKGIGAKSAERIIVDLKDKLEREGFPSEKIAVSHNTKKQEALTGLTMLGFNKIQAGKAIDKVIRAGREDDQEAELSVEEMIKKALKML
ncbi:MAG: Holliday junction branch migration protein RuvA [Bacteroidales bacterium]